MLDSKIYETEKKVTEKNIGICILLFSTHHRVIDTCLLQLLLSFSRHRSFTRTFSRVLRGRQAIIMESFFFNSFGFSSFFTKRCHFFPALFCSMYGLSCILLYFFLRSFSLLNFFPKNIQLCVGLIK